VFFIIKYRYFHIYRYERDQLFKINFGVYAVEALTAPQHSANPSASYRHLYKQQKLEENGLIEDGSGGKTRPASTFVPTLYVGFYDRNLYALPSLVYNSNLNLIDGPVLTTSAEQQVGGQQHEIVPFPLVENMQNESREDAIP
jgi:hypothetical protein